MHAGMRAYTHAALSPIYMYVPIDPCLRTTTTPYPSGGRGEDMITKHEHNLSATPTRFASFRSFRASVLPKGDHDLPSIPQPLVSSLAMFIGLLSMADDPFPFLLIE